MRSPCLTAYIFKAREPICMIFGTHLCHSVLNTSNSNLLKFVMYSGKTQQHRFRFWKLLQKFQLKILSRTSLERLLNKSDSSSVLKDQKTQAIHSQPEQQKSSRWVETSYAVRHGGKVLQASGTSEWRLCLEYVLQQNVGHIKHFFNWKNDVCAVDIS